jgi:predicted nucleic acid-binding protein
VTEAAPEAVCDSGPLIHLDELDCIDLLQDFSTVWVPEAVREEVRGHRPHALEHEGTPFHAAREEPRSDPRLAALVHTLALDRGEQEALHLASSLPGAILLTDDSAARVAAGALGLEVHGSIGVIIRSIRMRRRSRHEVLLLLRGIPKRSSLYIRPSLLAEICRDVEASELGSG